MSKDNKTREASDFVNVVRDIVKQEFSTRDSTAVAIIESINQDGTLNLYVLPDMNTVIHNVTNQCRYSFKAGDTATLFLINGKTNNAFVVAKHDPKVDFLFDLENELEGEETALRGNSLTAGKNIISGTIQLTTNWIQGNDEYYQDVFVPGISTDSNLFISPLTREDQTALNQASVFCTLSAGKVRFFVLEEPTDVININYTIISA